MCLPQLYEVRTMVLGVEVHVASTRVLHVYVLVTTCTSTRVRTWQTNVNRVKLLVLVCPHSSAVEMPCGGNGAHTQNAKDKTPDNPGHRPYSTTATTADATARND